MNEQDSYEEFEATTLFCARCKQSVPVRKKLLLLLPDGDKYSYLCSLCGNVVGSKTVPRKDNLHMLIK